MFHATTILSVRTKDQVALIGDGQVTMGSVVAKGTAQKIRKLHGNILAGYAGGVADALILIEQLEKSLDKHSGQLQRACIELVKGWRSSMQYAKLEASVLVSDLNNTYTISGDGTVLDTSGPVCAIGSGGEYAYCISLSLFNYYYYFKLAAALALCRHTDMNAEQIAKSAMEIASDLCMYINFNFDFFRYTNKNFNIEILNKDDVKEK